MAYHHPDVVPKIVLIILAAFGSLFYVTFVTVLVKHRNEPPFNSPFFRFCISISVSDLANMFHALFFNRIPELGFLFGFFRLFGQYLAKYATVSLFFIGLTQVNAVLLLAMNRFTAVALPLKHQKVMMTMMIDDDDDHDDMMTATTTTIMVMILKDPFRSGTQGINDLLWASSGSVPLLWGSLCSSAMSTTRSENRT